MSAGTYRLTLDFVRRSPWWVWLAIVGFHGLWAWDYFGGRDHHLRMVSALLAFQIAQLVKNAAWLRIVRTMPVSLREIGQTRWWAEIGVPGIAFSVIDIAVLLILLGAHAITADIWEIASAFVAGWAALGIWSALIPIFAYANRLSVWLAVFFGLAWLMTVISASLGFVPIVPAWLWISAGIACAIALYGFAPWLAALPVNPRRFGNQYERPARGRRTSPKRIGWWALVELQLTMSLIIFTIFAGVPLAMHFIIHLALPPNFYLTVSPLLLAFGTMAMPAPRLLRTIPITAGSLSLIIQLVWLAPFLIFFAILVAVNQGLADKIPDLPLSFMLVLAPQTLQLPIRFRFGSVTAQILITALLLSDMMLLTAEAIMGNRWISPPWSGGEIASALLIGLAGYGWTRYELGRGSHAYRSRPPSVMGLGAFSGRITPVA